MLYDRMTIVNIRVSVGFYNPTLTPRYETSGIRNIHWRYFKISVLYSVNRLGQKKDNKSV